MDTLMIQSESQGHTDTHDHDQASTESRSKRWTSNAAVHSLRVKGLRNISPVPFVLSPCSGHHIRHSQLGSALPSSPMPNSLAHASAGSDSDCDIRFRPCPALGWAHRRDPPGRRGLVPTRRKALARSRPRNTHDPHRHSGRA